MLRLDVAIRTDGLHVRLWSSEQPFRHVAVDELIGATVVTYSASRYAGWHWGRRTTPSGRTVHRLRGDSGVVVSLTQGRELFIGSQDPERLRTGIARIT